MRFMFESVVIYLSVSWKMRVFCAMVDLTNAEEGLNYNFAM